MRRDVSKERFWRTTAFLFFFFLSARACAEFYNVAWGTGNRWGGFALSWLVLFLLFALACALSLFVLTAGWMGKLDGFFAFLIRAREKTGIFRWLAALFVLFFPAYFFQYTSGGVIFQGTYFRLWVWTWSAVLFATLTTMGEAALAWRNVLAALLLSSAALVLVFEFADVTMYPFSLGWSEGNRLWDYSILFGRQRYLYPAEKEIPVLLDFGRQLIGAIPFLLPFLTIGMERFWVALTFVFPYFLLGLPLFRFSAKDKKEWLGLTLWTFLFLKQGPIHPPLVLSAAAVALAWRSPLRWAILLVAGAGYFAHVSRETWMFAPAAWIVVLEFVGGSLEREGAKQTWLRSVVLGIAGVLGGVVFPVYLQPLLLSSSTSAPSSVPAASAAPSLLDMAVSTITRQPLLWYRLLPNATYKTGVLLGLLIAVVPLLLILFHLTLKQYWKTAPLQKAALLLPALVFLIVGLIASAKIGGGGDLHNLDMFLITLTFAAALAWYGGGREWIQNGGALSDGWKLWVVLFFALPALNALGELYPYGLQGDAARLMVLADKPDVKSLGFRPDSATVQDALHTIREEVEAAKSKGDVLFMDQRQLLTFGYIQDVPLVAEYEKKVLMNEALSRNRAYFQPFYEDLAARRFSLILTSPLRVVEQGGENQFGEENDLWAKYVAAPILCYYEVKIRLNEVGVHLLVPQQEPRDCSSVLP